MSRTKNRDLIERLAIQVKCPTCGAKSEEWCQTFRPRKKGPSQATVLHAGRLAIIREVWQAGFDAAMAQTQDRTV